MRISRPAASAAVAAGVTALGIGPLAAAPATVPRPWKNCTNVHKRYPHGVGKLRAHDHTSGTPVTNFKHSTRLYRVAISYNSARGYNLDRDKDGIACEKA